jgi:hypothetical protein
VRELVSAVARRLDEIESSAGRAGASRDAGEEPARGEDGAEDRPAGVGRAG